MIKTMKKILFTTIGALAIAFTLSACTKNETSEPDNEFQRINVRINGVQRASTRMIEAAAAQGQLVLSDGHIFVINAMGSIVYSVALDVNAATTAPGQTITTPVSSDSRIYVLGNIPSSLDVSQFTTIEQLRNHQMLLSHSEQTNYKSAMLANDTGSPASINKIEGTSTATATVTISPLFSRIELAQVNGSANVEKFEVTGVFVDEYYSSFTLAGAGAGPILNQSVSTDFTGNIGDAAVWPSTVELGNAIATPGGTSVWAYHVASAGIPRLIVRLNHIYIDDDGDGASGTPTVMLDNNGDGEGVRYVTVTGYIGDTAPTVFQRGKFYQVQSITVNASDDDTNNIGQEPNPTAVTVTAQVNVTDWAPVILTPETR